MRASVLVVITVTLGCEHAPMPDAGTDGDANVALIDAPSEVSTDAATSDVAPSGNAGVDAPRDAGPTPLRTTVELVTDRHRYVPGAMFGGWGPHLGHLVRAGGALYWVDDLCDQTLPGDCDVNVNRRIGVHRRDLAGWSLLATIPLAGVQQNTGTIADHDALVSYGVDVLTGAVTECRFAIGDGTGTCRAIPLPTGANANYVGAAIAPSGAHLAWWTNVVDGGGGSFSYVVDYGSGWNGPRTGPIGGYGDFAYAHAGFAPEGAGVTFFGQVVAGLAPDWTFSTLVGEASLATSDAVTFANALAAPAGDTIASTNDLWIDPSSGDTHLLARAGSGAVVYFHRPSGGAWTGPTVLAPAGLRARFLESERWLAIVTGTSEGRVDVRRYERGALGASTPLTAIDVIEEEILLPSWVGSVLAIYPEARATQRDPVGALCFGVVGASAENEITFVLLE